MYAKALADLIVSRLRGAYDGRSEGFGAPCVDRVPAKVELVKTSEQADAAWSAQIGPALSEDDVARLLSESTSAVRADKRLLRISNRDGRAVYPVAQFDAGGQVSGLADVVDLLTGSLQPLTIASWLTAPNQGLANRTPIQALLAGDDDAVLTLAGRLSNGSSH